MPTTTHTSRRRLLRLLGAAAVASLAFAGTLVSASPANAAEGEQLPSPAPLLQRSADHVTADDLPTVQINDGYVWAQTTIGTTVYAVGQFSNVRPAGAAVGTNLTPRSNILAYDITTGNLVTTFAPTTNGVVKSVAASPDGKRIYIGGTFNTVNGQSRWNFAALDAATGQLVSGVTPAIGGTGVYAIAATATAVYVGGLFTQANGVARTNLAGFSPVNGALLAWAPTTDRQVDAMVMEPQTKDVVVGGRFYAVNGQVQRGLVDLDPVSGAINTSWQAPTVVQNGWSSGSNAGKAGIFGLATDSSGVYGTGWVFANAQVGNLEGVFAAEAGSGSIRWISDCHGDHYGVYSTGSVVYAADHTHQCETVGLWPDLNPQVNRYVESYTTAVGGILTRSSTAGSTYKDWSGTPSPSAYNWFPDFTVGTTSGLGQAALSITGTAGYISVAGEFGTVNNLSRQGLTRFAVNPPGGSSQGPRVTTANWTPHAVSANPGTTRISIPANWDRDDLTLTYSLRRQGVSTPVATRTVDSTWWKQPTVVLDDTGLTPGSSQTYTVTATDPDGNSRASSPVTVTVATGVTSVYASAVLADDPSLYYRLGGVTADWAGANDPVYGSGVSTVVPGGPSETGSAGSVFNGTSAGIVSSTSKAATASGLSEEAWFRTTSTKGGMLIGYGDSQTGLSSNHDRHVYMTTAGKIVFGVYPGSAQTIISPASYNDGVWHHVVSTLGSDGMKLYVDGVLVTSKASVTTAQAFTGYWRVGGDNINGWPSAPGNYYFNGSLDEVAIYPSTLSAQQVSLHYGIGKGLTPPTAAFTAAASGLDVALDASGSSAATGHSVSSYAWDFGDGQTGIGGPTTAHTYAVSGTYRVTLTVTDDSGLAASTTTVVDVLGPNIEPTASFTHSVSGLTTVVDGTASADPDGSVISYAWDWGDGAAGGSGATATHAYALPGEYTVTLTVTDNRGGTASTAQTVTVTHADPTATFTVATDRLQVAVDATGSSAADGATLTYAWDWGDGSAPGSGPQAAHTYAEDGTYAIRLTVTDSVGSTNAADREITVNEVAYAASDDFTRTVSSGWGAADVGGTWAAQLGAASAGSVDGSTGRITLPGGQTRNMALTSVSVLDSESTVNYSLSAPPSEGNSYIGILSRQSAATDYKVRVWMKNDGSVWIVAMQGWTNLASTRVAGLTWTANEVFTLKTSVTGTDPTTIQAKVWKAGTVEPSNWQYTTTDSTPALQTAGSTSLHFARSANISASTASFDAFRVVDLDAGAEPTPTAPTASFTVQSADLGASVDASGSAASEGGAIASYSWDWGDGTAAGTGVTASHAYAVAGTYTVTLTVADQNGLTGTATQTVTASDPPVVEPTAPTASFTVQSADLGASVDASGSAASEGGAIASYSWDWGDGTAAGTGVTASHAYAVAGTYTVTLTVADQNGLTGTATQTVTASDPPVVEPTAPIASDSFGRTVASGWGTADLGGAWTTLSGSASAASVSEGAALLTLSPGSIRFQSLNEVSVGDVEMQADFSAVGGPDTGASYVGLFARRDAAGDSYRVLVWLRADGRVWLVNQRGTTVLSSYAVPGATWAAGETFTVRAQITGSGTTTIQAKVWKSAGAEPSDWQLASTDTTAGLQVAGPIGVSVNRSPSAIGSSAYVFSSFRAEVPD